MQNLGRLAIAASVNQDKRDNLPLLGGQALHRPHRRSQIERRIGRRPGVVPDVLAGLRRGFVRRPARPRSHRVDPYRSANLEYPPIESRSGMELIEGSERFFRGHLCKIVRVCWISCQCVSEPSKAWPNDG